MTGTTGGRAATGRSPARSTSTWKRRLRGRPGTGRFPPGAAQLDPVDLRADDFTIPSLMEEFATAFVESSSPFGNYLAGGPLIVLAYGRHAQNIDRALVDVGLQYLNLLEELVELGWALDGERTVTDDDLRHHGFDPGSVEPDLEW